MSVINRIESKLTGNTIKSAKFTLKSEGIPLKSMSINFQHKQSLSDIWKDDGNESTNNNGVANKSYSQSSGIYDFRAKFAGTNKYESTGWKQVLKVKF